MPKVILVKFKQPELFGDGHLGDVLRLHGYLLVPFLQVNLGEDCAPGSSSDEVHHARDRVGIWHGDGIEAAAITAELLAWLPPVSLCPAAGILR